MYPQISYQDIVLLAELTSRTLLRSRTAYGNDNRLACRLSRLLTAERQLQERAADPRNPVNTYIIRQSRASIVGGCWKVVNDLDIALERPSGLTEAETTGLDSIYDFTFAIHLFLSITSSETCVKPKEQAESRSDDSGILELAINSLIPTLIARAIDENRRPCLFVERGKHVLAELRVTMPDIGAERYSQWIEDYLAKLHSEVSQRATASTSDEQQCSEAFSTCRGASGFTPSHPLKVFETFMKEEEEETSGTLQVEELTSTNEDETSFDHFESSSATAVEADRELHRIYSILHDCQLQYENSVNYEPQDPKIRERRFRALDAHLQRDVIEELDKLLLSNNQQLRGFKKYLIYWAQKLLADIEQTGNKVPYNGKKRRTS
ncbi:MAG: hypothetical protein Q9213_006333 [Squamulea squamosa]